MVEREVSLGLKVYPECDPISIECDRRASVSCDVRKDANRQRVS